MIHMHHRLATENPYPLASSRRRLRAKASKRDQAGTQTRDSTLSLGKYTRRPRRRATQMRHAVLVLRCMGPGLVPLVPFRVLAAPG